MPSDEKVNVLTLRLGLIGLPRSAVKRYKTEQILALDRGILDLKQRFHLLPHEEIQHSETVRVDILQLLEKHGSKLWPVPHNRNRDDRKWLPRAPSTLLTPNGESVEYKTDLVYDRHKQQ